jgi:hypothetical protein
MREILIALVFGWVAGAQTTVWGGDHVDMEMTGTGARLEFDCAHGTIDEALHADASGAFHVKGTFTPERGGPSRDGDAPPVTKVTYAGTIKDDTMTLRIVVDGQDRPGTYELTRGRPGNVRKCR